MKIAIRIILFLTILFFAAAFDCFYFATRFCSPIAEDCPFYIKSAEACLEFQKFRCKSEWQGFGALLLLFGLLLSFINFVFWSQNYSSRPIKLSINES